MDIKSKHFKLLLAIFAAILIVAAIAGCSQKQEKSAVTDEKEAADEKETKELVIYSGRKEPLIKPVIKAFEEETGIKVTLHSGGASELANQILEEASKPRADVIIANDAGTLEFLRLEGALQKNDSENIDKVDKNFRAEDGSWIGVSARSRVIMYNTDLVKAEDAPKSVYELADPKWEGQVGIASSSNESLIGHITAIRKIKGDEFAEDFLRKLLANKPVILKGHTEVRKAVGSGEIKLGLVNHYYYHLQKAEGSPVGVIYPDQDADDQEGDGVMVNIAGAGIINGAKNLKAAQRFIDFLISPKAQEIFAGVNYEAPVIGGVPIIEARPLYAFKQMDIPLHILGEELQSTMDLLEKVGMP